MQLLITGGLGYVGQALVPRLHRAGHRLTVLGRTPRAHRLDPASFDFICADVCDLADMDLSADAVIHLACANGSGSDPRQDYDITLDGTHRLLDWSVRHRIPRFLFFSTIQVYGDLHARHIDEQTPASPNNPYGETHALAEEALAAEIRKRTLRGLVVRPTIGYGELHPDMPRWSITPACFCREAVEKGSITLSSNGCQFRNYVPMGYVADAVVRMVARWDALADWESVNLSGDETLRVIEVAELVKSAAESLFAQPVALHIDRSDRRQYAPFAISRSRQESIAGAPPRLLRPAVEQMLESLRAPRP